MRLNWSADDYDHFNDPKKDDSSKLKAGWSSFLHSVIMCEIEGDKFNCAETKAPAVWSAMQEVVDVLQAEHDWLCERTGQPTRINLERSTMLTHQRWYEMV